MKRKGKIISNGKYNNWTLEISTDFENTGGVYLFIYNNDTGYDYWFSNMKEAYKMIKEDNAEILWEAENI